VRVKVQVRFWTVSTPVEVSMTEMRRWNMSMISEAVAESETDKVQVILGVSVLVAESVVVNVTSM
jgi:hypothetical protein